MLLRSPTLAAAALLLAAAGLATAGSPTEARAPAARKTNAPAQSSRKADADRLERRLTGVCRRVGPAVVLVEGRTGESRQAFTGVIVTPEGHVVMQDYLSHMALTVSLPDGRRAAAKALGWSRAQGIAVAKLEGAGPWPHAPLRPDARVRAGQPIVTFAHALNDEQNVPHALPDLEWADRVAPGHWFMRPPHAKWAWQRRNVAFDLEGRFLGIESVTRLSGGSTFTHADRIRALWPHLIERRNLDELRLAGAAAGTAGERAPAPPVPGTAIPREVVERATAAAVRIRSRPDAPRGFSGVVISREGLVATCAHHGLMPRTRVTVSLPDGRDVAAEVLGLSPRADVGLIRITEPGIYPHAEPGNSLRAAPGEPCFAAGYGPSQARQPDVRHTTVAAPRDGIRSHVLPTDGNARFVGGDSGGPVFDREGRILGMHTDSGLPHPDGPLPHGSARVELLRLLRDDLHAPFEQAAAPDLAPVEAALAAVAGRRRSSVVEVLDGDTALALGTIVGADGLIVTRASMLPESPACRLADGRVLPAAVRSVVREHDLAVLKVDASRLAPVRWTKKKETPVGQVLALAGPAPAHGTAAHGPAAFPPERGLMRARLQDTERGLEVVELVTQASFEPLSTDPVTGFGPQPLRKGDLLLAVEGRPVANQAELAALLDLEPGPPAAVAGDRVRLEVLRDGERRELRLVLGPPQLHHEEGQSARRSGFPKAFGVAVRSGSRLLGGPVVDRDGAAVGIAVAARGDGWILVVPAAVVRDVCRR
jgi:serine protease Do